MSDKTRQIEAQENESGSRDELRELLKQFRTAFLVTHEGAGRPRGRPLAIAKVEDDATVWFATASHSPKVAEIANDAAACVLCHRDRDEAWVSLSGAATLVRDRAKIAELWGANMKPWFEGPDDPAIVLVKVKTAHAEYYESKKPMIARVFEMIKGMVTHAAPKIGQTKHFEVGRLSEPGRLSR
ncbi:MAG: pyridoxamine 5'-phosphate oxidase family protein [Polyangiales bacterium]